MPQVRAARVSSPWDPADAGSNNWVVSGSRTPSGIPILANDPHRRIEMPALRYFVHLNAPGWNVIGAGEPPFVGVDAGHNDRMAWGFTFAGTDMVDLYVEELHAEQPNMVRWRDGWEALRIIREEIRIKGQAPRTVELKFSRHGPIFYEDTVKPARVRRTLGRPGAGNRGLLRQLQAGAGEELHRLLRSGDVLESPHAQPDLRRCGRQHRAPGVRAHSRPRRLERPASRARHGEVRVERLPERSAPRDEPGPRLHRDGERQHASTGLQGPAGLLSLHRRCRDLADHAAPPDPRRGQDPLCRGPRADPAGRVLAHGRARHPPLSGVDRQGSRKPNERGR